MQGQALVFVNRSPLRGSRRCREHRVRLTSGGRVGDILGMRRNPVPLALSCAFFLGGCMHTAELNLQSVGVATMGEPTAGCIYEGEFVGTGGAGGPWRATVGGDHRTFGFT